MNIKLLRRLGSALTTVSFFASLFVLAGFFKGNGIREAFAGFSGISPLQILMSAVFALLSYLCLIMYDILAVRNSGRKLPLLKCAEVSFTANTFGNNIGLSILSSSAVRLRLYSLWGFGAQEIAGIIIFCNSAEAAGFAALSSILLNLSVWPAQYHALIKYLSFSAGALLIALLLAYIAWSTFAKKPLSAFGAAYRPPGFLMSIAQTAVSAADWFFAGLALYVLLPSGYVPFPLFFASYLASEVLGIASNVPGGFGVFDAAAISLISLGGGGGSAVISSVIMFRLLYYILPLALSYLVYGVAEAESARSNIFIKAGEIKDLLSSTPGYAFSLFAFLAGSAAIMIPSIPALQPRIETMAFLPVPVKSLLALVCALCGAGLIMMTRGLQKNIYSSYTASMILFAAVSLLLLTQGFSYEASFVIFVILCSMIFFRESFYRKAAILSEKPTPGLFLSTAGVMAVCAMLAYITAAPGAGLFNTAGALPLVSSFVALLIWITAEYFSPFKPLPHEAPPYDIGTASKIALEDPDSLMQLAMLGDKKLLFSLSRASFIMYAQCGSHFVALGDPSGPYVEIEELVWKFRRLARVNKGMPVFFNATDDNLHFYDNSGLNYYRIGEEAKVAVEYYPVDKKKDEKLKALASKLESQGYSFKMMPRNAPALFYKAAAQVSDEWLRSRKLKETGFLIGAFNPDYLKNFHIAAVYKGDKLVLFANILASINRDEFRVDMMRSIKGIGDEVEKYLNYKLVLWGKEKHYAFFNLGLAPVPGGELNTYTPVFSPASAALYNHGARFANAWALRREKEDFSPAWFPRYIICDNFMQVPVVFSEISLLAKK